jgi:hypothetical protein
MKARAREREPTPRHLNPPVLPALALPGGDKQKFLFQFLATKVLDESRSILCNLED